MADQVNGFVCLYKPSGIRSFSFLSFLKKCYPGVKIGHAGTLDEFAEGLMIAGLGASRKLIDYCMRFDKDYRTIIHFGVETDTLDPLGKKIKATKPPSYHRVQQVVTDMNGMYQQTPPDYCALKIKGVPSWSIRRSGGNPILKSREVHISNTHIHAYQDNELDISLTLSKGGYVRSYARDLAYACKSVAYVKTLHRTRIGPFLISQACRANEYDEQIHLISPQTLKSYLLLPSLYLSSKGEESVRKGKELFQYFFSGEAPNAFFASNEAETLLILVKKMRNHFRYVIIEDRS